MVAKNWLKRKIKDWVDIAIVQCGMKYECGQPKLWHFHIGTDYLWPRAKLWLGSSLYLEIELEKCSHWNEMKCIINTDDSRDLGDWIGHGCEEVGGWQWANCQSQLQNRISHDPGNWIAQIDTHTCERNSSWSFFLFAWSIQYKEWFQVDGWLIIHGDLQLGGCANTCPWAGAGDLSQNNYQEGWGKCEEADNIFRVLLGRNKTVIVIDNNS